MSKKKIKTTIFLIILYLISFYGYKNENFRDISETILEFVLDDDNNNNLDLNNNYVINNTKKSKKISKSKFLENYNYSKPNIKINLNETLNEDIQVNFCPSIECFNLFDNSFKLAKHNIKCAFYELDEYNLSQTLLSKAKNNINISIIIDDRYLNEKNYNLLKNNSNIDLFSDIKRRTKYNNYMHDKFCIIDGEIIITGSTNPTNNGIFKNNNNLIKINSKLLATNYENEFNMMRYGLFGYNKKTSLNYNNLNLKYKNNSYKISTYMCPQDNCDIKILSYLENAKTDIKFATFALTHDKIAEVLIQKSQNLNVTGLIEKRNWNLKGSDANKLNNSFHLYKDKNKNNMHNKFFIIDNKIVISGSMNPSTSGAKYNDENIIIIENKHIANLFINEFETLIN